MVTVHFVTTQEYVLNIVSYTPDDQKVYMFYIRLQVQLFHTIVTSNYFFFNFKITDRPGPPG